MTADWSRFPSPCYVVDARRLRQNLEILARVQREADCSILLALKGFAMWSTFPVVREYLTGATASSLHELRLAHEEMGGEAHIYAAAYREDEFAEILRYADHLVFNSFNQWRQFKDRALAARKSCGIRVNPEHSEVKTALYDPCAPCSRLGVTLANFEPDAMDGLDGLHFHTLCELNSDSLERTLQAFEAKFSKYFHGLKWINFGGGHHITRPGYDVALLIRLVSEFSRRYSVRVYLEPGEAIALNTGVLVTTVLDVIHNGMDIAILDTSATAHMPDVLEMPYRPTIVGAGDPGQYAHTYRLAGLTCLAGDVIGDWSFQVPLRPGDKVIFEDMAHYTMVKNTTFNGVNLPAIALYEPDTDQIKIVREFGYEDYKTRLS